MGINVAQQDVRDRFDFDFDTPTIRREKLWLASGDQVSSWNSIIGSETDDLVAVFHALTLPSPKAVCRPHCFGGNVGLLYKPIIFSLTYFSKLYLLADCGLN
jgi:hypothetical protein